LVSRPKLARRGFSTRWPIIGPSLSSHVTETTAFGHLCGLVRTTPCSLRRRAEKGQRQGEWRTILLVFSACLIDHLRPRRSELTALIKWLAFEPASQTQLLCPAVGYYHYVPGRLVGSFKRIPGQMLAQTCSIYSQVVVPTAHHAYSVSFRLPLVGLVVSYVVCSGRT
jgi:hypothetical protein